MALNPDTITFLYRQLSDAEPRGYKAIVSQLFTYLEDKIKDNPIFDEYQSSYGELKELIEEDTNGRWDFPNTLDDAKRLSFAIFKAVSLNSKDWFLNFTIDRFGSSNFIDATTRFNRSFYQYFGKALEDIINANPEIERSAAQKNANNTVFLIHGHDSEIISNVQLLLNIAGINSVVLHEQPDKGRTIIDKLVDETSKAGYAVALLTPDDILENRNGRARQNVILEIGYFIGLLGKERIRLVVKDNVEIPSDLQGILYEKYEESGRWKIKLLKEIQAVGIYVDMEAVVKRF